MIEPQITTERISWITFLLCQGKRYRTAEIAAMLGMTRQGAHAQLSRMAHVIPLVLDGGEWYLVRQHED